MWWRVPKESPLNKQSLYRGFFSVYGRIKQCHHDMLYWWRRKKGAYLQMPTDKHTDQHRPESLSSVYPPKKQMFLGRLLGDIFLLVFCAVWFSWFIPTVYLPKWMKQPAVLCMCASQLPSAGSAFSSWSWSYGISGGYTESSGTWNDQPVTNRKTVFFQLYIIKKTSNDR